MNRGLKHNYRVTEYEDRMIRNKAKRAKTSVSAYVRKAALEKEIIVIDGLREMMPGASCHRQQSQSADGDSTQKRRLCPAGGGNEKQILRGDGRCQRTAEGR